MIRPKINNFVQRRHEYFMSPSVKAEFVFRYDADKKKKNIHYMNSCGMFAFTND